MVQRHPGQEPRRLVGRTTSFPGPCSHIPNVTPAKLIRELLEINGAWDCPCLLHLVHFTMVSLGFSPLLPLTLPAGPSIVPAHDALLSIFIAHGPCTFGTEYSSWHVAVAPQTLPAQTRPAPTTCLPLVCAAQLRKRLVRKHLHLFPQMGDFVN